MKPQSLLIFFSSSRHSALRKTRYTPQTKPAEKTPARSRRSAGLRGRIPAAGPAVPRGAGSSGIAEEWSPLSFHVPVCNPQLHTTNCRRGSLFRAARRAAARQRGLSLGHSRDRPEQLPEPRSHGFPGGSSRRGLGFIRKIHDSESPRSKPFNVSFLVF
jgi:hypothetical protein